MSRTKRKNWLKVYGFDLPKHYGTMDGQRVKANTCYQTAKGWRSCYNRQLRRANKVLVQNADDQTVFKVREEVKSGDLVNHPGNLW